MRQGGTEYSLPSSVRERLEQFSNQLSDALGEQLVSLVLYGSLAKGEYTQTRSNVNVLLVLKEVTVEQLDKAVSPVQQGFRDLALAIMVLTEDDLRRSTDVFPIKFQDIQQHHLMLRGKDVLADLHIARDHLRLRCEQEMKNLLFRLRQLYLHRAHRPELLEGTLSSTIPSFLGDLSALLMLKTGHTPTGNKAVADAASRELGLDGKTLRAVMDLKSGSYKPHRTEMKDLYASFMAAVARAADIVDGL